MEVEGEKDIETVEETRLKMTKQLLQNLNNNFQTKTDEDDFFNNLLSKTQADVEIFKEDDDPITKRLKY
jgi:hypothetical protein